LRARWIASRRTIHHGVFITHGKEPALKGLAERIADRTIPTARIFNPVLDDIYELSTAEPREDRSD
jgi:metallo-beta-lactamase family protein